MNKQQISSLLQVIVSILLLVFLFKLIDFQSFLNTLKGIRPAYFAGGLLLYLLALCISAVRWQFILKTTGESIAILRLISINFVGSFFSIFLPTAAGGDLARMYQSARQGMINTMAISTVLLDRVIGLMSLVIISMMALLVGYRYTGDQIVVYSVVGFSLALVVAWWIFFNLNIMRRFSWVLKLSIIKHREADVRRLYQSLHGLHNQPKLIVSTLTVSFIAQVIEIGSAILVARALDVKSDSFYFFIFIPLIWLVTMLPISLNGLGLREGAFVFFFGQIGVISTQAIALSLLVYFCRLLAGVLGGGVFLQSSIADIFKKWFKRDQRLL